MSGYKDVCTMALWVIHWFSDERWVSVSHDCKQMSWLDIQSLKWFSTSHGGYGVMVIGWI